MLMCRCKEMVDDHWNTNGKSTDELDVVTVVVVGR